MRLKYSLQVNEVAGQYVAVAVGKDAHKFKNIIFLNKVGQYIIELLQKEMDREDIFATVLNHYDGDPKVIRNETASFLDKLVELDLLNDEQET